MTIFCESERLYLRGAKPSDSLLMVKWKNDSLIRKMSVGSDILITKENEEDDIRSSLTKGQLYFIIVMKGTDKPIGYIRVNWMDNKEKYAWLRFGLGDERGNGYSKEALRVFISELFKKGVHRIDAEVYHFNDISFQLLQTIGFKHEGTRREAHCENGQFADVFTLGLLESDFIPL
ncbi:MAG: GNAT family N-acetyltransferase [Bacillaceae bacterium]